MAWPRAILLIVIAPFLAGCTADFRPYDRTLTTPVLQPGTWWVVQSQQWSGDDPPYLDETRTYWVVGTRQVEDSPWNLLLAYEGAVVPSRDALVPFRLVLSPPALANPIWGVPSLPPYGWEWIECRGSESCATPDLLPAYSRWAETLEFPLEDHYRRSDYSEEGFSGDSYVNTTGDIRGWHKPTLAFGRVEALRIDEHQTYHGFEYGGYSDRKLDYVPELGLIARQSEESCGLPFLLWCGGRSGSLEQVLATGFVEPPSVAEVGTWFSLQQADAIRILPRVENLEGGAANFGRLGQDDEFRVSANLTGLRRNDTVAVEWLDANGTLKQRDNGNISTYQATSTGALWMRVLVSAPQGNEVQRIDLGPIRIGLDRWQALDCDGLICHAEFHVGAGLQSVEVILSQFSPAWAAGSVELVDPAGIVRDSKTCACTVQANVVEDAAGTWVFRWQASTPDPGAQVRILVD